MRGMLTEVGSLTAEKDLSSRLVRVAERGDESIWASGSRGDASSLGSDLLSRSSETALRIDELLSALVLRKGETVRGGVLFLLREGVERCAKLSSWLRAPGTGVASPAPRSAESPILESRLDMPRRGGAPDALELPADADDADAVPGAFVGFSCPLF